MVEETNSDWWYGVCDGQVGYFPPNNVQSIKVAFKVCLYFLFFCSYMFFLFVFFGGGCPQIPNKESCMKLCFVSAPNADEKYNTFTSFFSSHKVWTDSQFQW